MTRAERALAHLSALHTALFSPPFTLIWRSIPPETNWGPFTTFQLRSGRVRSAHNTHTLGSPLKRRWLWRRRAIIPPLLSSICGRGREEKQVRNHINSPLQVLPPPPQSQNGARGSGHGGGGGGRRRYPTFPPPPPWVSQLTGRDDRAGGKEREPLARRTGPPSPPPPPPPPNASPAHRGGGGREGGRGAPNGGGGEGGGGGKGGARSKKRVGAGIPPPLRF